MNSGFQLAQAVFVVTISFVAIGILVGGSFVFSGYIGLSLDDEDMAKRSSSPLGPRKLLAFMDILILSSMGRVLEKLCSRSERYKFEVQSIQSGLYILAGSLTIGAIVSLCLPGI
jgi:hypothetical protein